MDVSAFPREKGLQRKLAENNPVFRQVVKTLERRFELAEVPQEVSFHRYCRGAALLVGRAVDGLEFHFFQSHPPGEGLEYPLQVEEFKGPRGTVSPPGRDLRTAHENSHETGLVGELTDPGVVHPGHFENRHAVGEAEVHLQGLEEAGEEVAPQVGPVGAHRVGKSQERLVVIGEAEADGEGRICEGIGDHLREPAGHQGVPNPVFGLESR